MHVQIININHLDVPIIIMIQEQLIVQHVVINVLHAEIRQEDVYLVKEIIETYGH